MYWYKINYYTLAAPWKYFQFQLVTTWPCNRRNREKVKTFLQQQLLLHKKKSRLPIKLFYLLLLPHFVVERLSLLLSSFLYQTEFPMKRSEAWFSERQARPIFLGKNFYCVWWISITSPQQGRPLSNILNAQLFSPEQPQENGFRIQFNALQ